jgi:ferredoxin-nitrite reductase
MSFTAEQKEYLAGLMAGIAARAAPAPAEPGEPSVYGTPLSKATKQERWKHEQHGLDCWDKLISHADADKLPDDADTFRFRYHGLFNVSPAQNAFMLRCRIPAGELSSAQLRGLADIAEDWGGGYADITTRANIQVREIQPRDMIHVLTKLQDIGLTSRGSGVDNVRNITASPTAGIDPQELMDTRPLAKALHHYILNHRDLYNLPRKFNVAFDGGGAISVVADTNDIGFVAVKHADAIAFRVQLAGITGHKQFAADSGILVKPSEAVAVAAAMIRVFIEHGDRTNRAKARLKYLIDKWGVKKFLAETQKKLAFPLVKVPLDQCQPAHPPIRHGHLGVFKQKQPGRNYIGVAIPVGRMTVRQMRRLADIAGNYGSGELRLTVFQNLIIPNVPDGFVETVKRNLVRMGFHYEATSIAGGVVACTGNTGCKYAATNTKGQAVELARYLESKLALDQPINIHLTGCPHSCAQHYMGDIGLLGVKTPLGEGYHVTLGGGWGREQAIGKEVFRGISFQELPALLENVLRVYLDRRQNGEAFHEFVRRHDLKTLQEMFCECKVS